MSTIEKYKEWKQDFPDEDYQRDQIHEFFADLTRGEMYSFMEGIVELKNRKAKPNKTMSKKTISVQIDVNKIDKKRLYKGKKGTYLNGVIFLNEEPDEYGNNGFICESVSKEEREQGVKGEILGNVKILGNSKPRVNEPVDFDDEGDDLPF